MWDLSFLSREGRCLVLDNANVFVNTSYYVVDPSFCEDLRPKWFLFFLDDLLCISTSVMVIQLTIQGQLDVLLWSNFRVYGFHQLAGMFQCKQN